MIQNRALSPLALGGTTFIPVFTVSTLFESVQTSISGTAINAHGKTATVTVNGEAWGNTTVSGTTWTVTGRPTTLMIGESVDVVVTIGSSTRTIQTNVKNVGSYFDATFGKTGNPVSDWVARASGITASQANPADQATDETTYLNSDSTDDYTLDSDLEATETNHVIALVVDKTTLVTESILRFSATDFAFQFLTDGRVRIQDGGTTITSTAAGFMETGQRILTLGFDAVGGTCDLALYESDGTITTTSIAYAVGRALAADTINELRSIDKLYALLQVSGATIPYSAAETVELASQLGEYHFGWDPLV